MKKNKIVVINGVNTGSTGSIANDVGMYVSSKLDAEYLFFVGQKRKSSDSSIVISNSFLSRQWNRLIVKIDGGDGFYNFFSTKQFIKKLKKINPTIIHLHNIHGYYFNLEMFFMYIKTENIPLIITMHDSWYFTGRCAILDPKCKGFSNGCNKCNFLSLYPRAFFDRSKKYYLIKRKLFHSQLDITFISPSEWLYDRSKESFLRDIDVRIINNGIDLSFFRPKESKIKEKLDILNKIVLLCSSNIWNESKGLNYINRLAEELDERFIILMIGNCDEDKVNKKIKKIGYVESREEMVYYYSCADIYINPTLNDNYPTVDMEALACGTPVITFDTGGSKEIVTNEVGQLVSYGNYEEFKQAIFRVLDKKIKKEDIIEYAQKFSKRSMLEKYLEIYKEKLKIN